VEPFDEAMWYPTVFEFGANADKMKKALRGDANTVRWL